jgi:hypothetical protein
LHNITTTPSFRSDPACPAFIETRFTLAMFEKPDGLPTQARWNFKMHDGS